MADRQYKVTSSEHRAISDGNKRMIVGYAAVFDKPADMGYWVEYVRAGAFSKTIAEQDIRCLYNHNPDNLLGRNKAGTLRLTEDVNGLRYECDTPDTDIGNRVYNGVERRDISQCSFGFVVIKDRWYKEKARTADGTEVEVDARELLEVKLYDVSPVTYPAYDQTTVDIESSRYATYRSAVGNDLTDTEKEQLKQKIATLTRRAAEPPTDPDPAAPSLQTGDTLEPDQTIHSDTNEEPSPSDCNRGISLLRMRLELAEKII